LHWQPKPVALRQEAGNKVTVIQDDDLINFEFFLSEKTKWPYAGYELDFYGVSRPKKTVDLTEYHSATFTVSCQPRNVMDFVLHLMDDKATDPNNDRTYRVASTYFNCDKNKKQVTIHLDDLITPEWWLSRYGFQLSEGMLGFNHTEVFGMVFRNSWQSPKGVKSSVQISDVSLHGDKPIYFNIAIIMSCITWLVYVAWALREYALAITNDVKERVNRGQQLIAYKKLSIAPQKNKEKSALLKYMATEYGNADINMEVACTALAINRTKINELLKEELGLTFSVYLNKLRLTEAARLLSEKNDANVSEVAHTVGYNNVSYFGKLFKAEYGCTPKSFKGVYKNKPDEPQSTEEA